MRQRNNKSMKLLIAVSLLGLSTNASALKIDYGAGAGVEYTDNARLSSGNEESDFITIGLLNGSLSESTRTLKADINASLNYETYQDNTFGDQSYLNLGAVVAWDLISNYLTWHLRDLFTQQRIDAASTDIPSNLSDTNAFSTGPTLKLPLSQRQMLTLSARYTNLNFDQLSDDSQQYTGRLGWVFDLTKQTQTGLDVSASKVTFDNEQLNPDYTRSTIGAFISGKRARTSYNTAVGFDKFNRDQFDDQKGFRASADISIDMTSLSSIFLVLSTKLQDSNSGLLNAQTDPSQGNLSTQQISGDVSRNSIFRLTYNRTGATLGARIWTEFRKLDYKEALLDRSSSEYGFGLDYQVSSLISTSARISYLDEDLGDQNQKFEEVYLNGDISYQLSRKLKTQLGVFYNTRDSNQNSNQYDEFGGIVSLVYGTGNISSAKRRYAGSGIDPNI